MEKIHPETNQIPVSKTENRIESRYLCVNVQVQYSPLDDAYIKNLGQKFYQAAIHDMSLSGLSFDLHTKVEIGEKILIHFHYIENYADRLTASVQWCREISPGFYRAGLKILESEIVPFDKTLSECKEPIGISTAPEEVEMLCPACKKNSILSLQSSQPVINGIIYIPLYDCSECGTTRSLPGLFS
ncbi:MAG: PilZ domain-containing protein [Spirochaetia bacterium]|nr:PilZ domain-containing protein [Spirochaetia bacterium]